MYAVDYDARVPQNLPRVVRGPGASGGGSTGRWLARAAL